jgi:TM2 domain-containing membrane protein YozV
MKRLDLKEAGGYMSVNIEQMAAHLPPDERQRVIRAYRRGAENETTAYLYCFFLGIFGAHRWYLGHWRSGLLHLIIPVLAALAVILGLLQVLPAVGAAIIVAILLAIGLGWEIIDLFGIDDEVRSHNRALAERLTATGALADDSAFNQAVAKLDTLLRAETTPQAAAGLAAAGGVTAADVASARALADEQGRVTSFDYYSTADNQISGNAQQEHQAGQPGANDWSFTEALPPEQPTPPSAAEDTTATIGQMAGAAAAGAALTEDVVSFQHHETEYGTSESLEVDQVALPPEAEPSNPNDDTWPEMRIPPEAEDAATASSVAAFAAGGTDWTDTASNVDNLPIADVEPGPDVVRVNLADEATPPMDPAATFAAVPLVAAADYTDAHPHARHNMPIADVEPGLAKPLYVMLPEPVEDTMVVLVPDPDSTQPGQWDTTTDAFGWGAAAAAGAAASTPSWEDTQPIPPEAYVPPTVPVTTQADEPEHETLAELAPLAATGAAAAMLAGDTASPAAETTETPVWPVEPAPVWPAEPEQAAAPAAPPAQAEATPGAAPAPQRMKRVRVVRRLVVDGEVVQEQVVEEIVPADTDTAATAEHLRESLGHATPEQIAQMAHLDPNAPLEVRQKTEIPDAGGSQS